MIKSKKRIARAAVALVGCAAAAGCAAMAEREAMDVERLLAAAGFKMQFASTPELEAHLETVHPQRKLVPAPVDGKMMYFYADSKYCRCMYVGDADAYGRYQELAVTKEIAEDYKTAAQAQEAATMNVWAGPWGPWGYW